jgi:ferredoxin-thioredoxin reductase catalytic subunit
MDLGSFKIYRKEGWMLNPNDKVVNGIMKGIARNDGHCPCHNKYSGTDDDICPCKAYREEDFCCCGLYIIEKTQE